MMGKRKTTEDGEPKKATRADSDLNESSSEDVCKVQTLWNNPVSTIKGHRST